LELFESMRSFVRTRPEFTVALSIDSVLITVPSGRVSVTVVQALRVRRRSRRVVRRISLVFIDEVVETVFKFAWRFDHNPVDECGDYCVADETECGTRGDEDDWIVNEFGDVGFVVDGKARTSDAKENCAKRSAINTFARFVNRA